MSSSQQQQPKGRAGSSAAVAAGQQDRPGSVAAGQRYPVSDSAIIDIGFERRSYDQNSSHPVRLEAALQQKLSAAAPGMGKDPDRLTPTARACFGAAAHDPEPGSSTEATEANAARLAEAACNAARQAGAPYRGDQKLDLLSGKTDVYACAVRGLLCYRASTATHMFFAMLVICFVQVTLLAMLLKAVATNTTKIQADPWDLLKVQANIQQLQLCGLQRALVSSNLQDSLPQSLLGAWENCSCLLSSQDSPMLYPTNCVDVSWMSDAVQSAYQNRSALPFVARDVMGLNSLYTITTESEKLQLLLVLLLSMGVLTVFVVREATSAAQLSYAIAASVGVLPIEYTASQHRNKFVPLFASKLRCCLAYVAPLLQTVVAVLAFCTAGSILSMPDSEFTRDLTQFIINSVALAFVIEIDDKAGEVLMWVLDHGWSEHDSSSNLLHVACYAPVECYKRRVSADTYSRGFAYLPWLSFRVPVVLGLCGLISMSQWFALETYAKSAAQVVEGSTTFVAGYFFVSLFLALLLFVLLCNHPFVVPKCDTFLDALIDKPNATTPFGTVRYTFLCKWTAWAFWVGFQLWSCVGIMVLLGAYHSNSNNMLQPLESGFGVAYFSIAYALFLIAIFPEVVYLSLNGFRQKNLHAMPSQ